MYKIYHRLQKDRGAEIVFFFIIIIIIREGGYFNLTSSAKS